MCVTLGKSRLLLSLSFSQEMGEQPCSHLAGLRGVWRKRVRAGLGEESRQPEGRAWECRRGSSS